tara:strand:- start:998 stop:2815 length:1818 start_codon:yes stop_codon:yes gene_type:complete
MISVVATFEMWVTMALIVAAVVAYASEKLSIEVTSVSIIAFLLVFFHIFPVTTLHSGSVLDAGKILSGFANPALIAVVALLVIGQGLVRTGALDHFVRRLVILRRRYPNGTIILTLSCVMVLSAVLNNTPVVVIFIPIMTALSDRLGGSVSGLMMPLSFAAILGGMTTLIGSSTNLLVSSTVMNLGHMPIGFFDFTIPGIVLAIVGIAYAIFVLPKLLPDRASPARELMGDIDTQYLTQIAVGSGSPLIGRTANADILAFSSDITIRLVQRGEHAFVPPLDEVTLRAGDEVVVSATREALTHLLENAPEILHGTSSAPGDQILGEVVVAPASRMIGRNLTQLGFHYQTHCIVLGIQRRSRMIRARMDEIRLDAGDVLLVLGQATDVMDLRANRDVLLLERSTHELIDRSRSTRATIIFLTVIALAASGLIPIVVVAVAGAAAMVTTGCLNIHQASRAIDRQVIYLVGAALALGTALEATGGAQFLAHLLVSALGNAGPAVVLSAFFLLVAAFTNVLSNNATAVLFTPIALNVAAELGITDPSIFIYALIFAANCSFATPMSYQTNLLVMAPGHYKFSDFLRAGLPLIALLWLTFSLFAPWYYGLI